MHHAATRYTAEVTNRSVHAGSSPIEAHLTKKHIGVAVTVVHDDESTETVEVKALTMLGAKKELTTVLGELGYAPATRWRGGVRVFRHG